MIREDAFQNVTCRASQPSGRTRASLRVLRFTTRRGERIQVFKISIIPGWMAWQMSPNPRRNVLAGRTMPPAAVAKPRMKKKTGLGGATSRGASISALSAYVAKSTTRRPRSTRSTDVGVAAVRCSPSRIGQREEAVAPRLRIPSRTYEPHLARARLASTPSTDGILTNALLAQRSSTSFPPRKQRRRARHVYLLGDRPGRPSNSHKVKTPNARTQSCREVLPAVFEAALLTGSLDFPTA
jgi:hypothetical protein